MKIRVFQNLDEQGTNFVFLFYEKKKEEEGKSFA